MRVFRQLWASPIACRGPQQYQRKNYRNTAADKQYDFDSRKIPSDQIQSGTQTIDYELERMPRKTLAISVHPDLSVIVEAPVDTSLEEVNERVTKRAKWILIQKRRFEIFLPDVPPRKYVSGESHRYLGRQYRLKAIEIDASEEQIKLSRQFLEVYTPDRSPSHVRELVEAWYREQVNKTFD